MEDMCYERLRAEACVDKSAHHALVNAGERDIVSKKEGGKKGSVRGSVHVCARRLISPEIYYCVRKLHKRVP
jgi:hypothetical protein